MVLANKITIGRIFLIPAVVGSLILYARSVGAGNPDIHYRWLALGLFLLAAVSDLLDGFVARHFDQHTRFGELMDPLADKCLLVSTIVTLTFTPWAWTFPLWFPIFIITRDLVAIAGAYLVHKLSGNVEMKAHWSGKAATFFQICAVCWVIMEISSPHPLWPTVLAIFFTLLSALVYIRSAIRQINSSKSQCSNPA